MLLVWLATLFLRLKMCTLSAVRQLGSEAKTRSIRQFLRLYVDEWRKPQTRWLISGNFTRPVALHAVRNVGFCFAAAFGASIYVQLGKYAFKQYGVGENG